MIVYRTTVAFSERAAATEANGTRISAIDAQDSLGYEGRGREEHSGENAPDEVEDLSSRLADNRRWQTGHEH